MTTTKTKYYRLLTADFFLLSILTLLINDFILKYKFPGLLTGKLSDFAGLFAFPYFFSIFFPRHKILVYVSTCLLFTFWKFPLADNFINFINSIELLHLYRTKDLTDLFALFILPISYLYLIQQSNLEYSITKFKAYTISAISLFAFTATTLGYETYKKQYPLNADVIVPVTRTALLTKYLSPSRDMFRNTKDSVLYIYIDHPERRKTEIIYQVTIKSKYTASTLIHLDKVAHVEIENSGLLSGPSEENMKEVQSYTRLDFIKMFRTLVSDNIKARKNVRDIFYAEKKYEDAEYGRIYGSQ